MLNRDEVARLLLLAIVSAALSCGIVQGPMTPEESFAKRVHESWEDRYGFSGEMFGCVADLSMGIQTACNPPIVVPAIPRPLPKELR